MAGNKEVPASQVVQGEEEATRRSKKKGTRDPSREQSVPKTLPSELEPRLIWVECTVADMHDDITQLSDSMEELKVKVGKRVEEGDQENEEASHPKAKYADHGKDKAKSKWESNGDERDGGKPSKPFKCFLCEGPHLLRYCPGRQKLNAMIAREEEPAPKMSVGAIVLGEKAQLARMKLLNATSAEEGVPKGEASSTTYGTGVKQGISLMVVEGEVNQTVNSEAQPTCGMARDVNTEIGKWSGTLDFTVGTIDDFELVLGMDFLHSRVKFIRVDGEMKAINSKAMPMYGRAWEVPVHLGKWKGKVNFLVVDIDDEDVMLGMEFLHKVLPFQVSDGMITITSKGSEIGIKLSQLKERDVRVSALKAWWAPRQRRQDAVYGRIKAATMLGTRHQGVPSGGTTRLKCGVNRRDGSAAYRSIQGSSAGDKEVPASQVVQGEEEATRRSKKKGTREPSRER
uniref:Uncharacterized protein n=1 Tax=Chenopodium quinoa TaxID=63459 RepID=A0A803MQY1_CHEQI